MNKLRIISKNIFILSQINKEYLIIQFNGDLIYNLITCNKQQFKGKGCHISDENRDQNCG